MTKQEKLISLENTIIGTAKARADEIVRESEEKRDSAIESFKQSIRLKSEGECLAKIHRAESDVTVSVSKAVFAAKQEVLKRRGELCDAVYVSAEKRILSYCESGEYIERMAAKLEEYFGKITPGDVILLCGRDAENAVIKAKAEELNLEVIPDKTILLGGFRLKLPGAGIMIDETFDTKLSELKRGENV